MKDTYIPKCFSCGKKAESNAWQFCPFCGQKLPEHPLPKKTKKRRNTKGQGSVCYVKATNKWKAVLKKKFIGYYETEEEGYDAINKYILSTKMSGSRAKIYTFEEIYKLWHDKYAESVYDDRVKEESRRSISSLKSMENAWKYFDDELRKCPINEITSSKLDTALINAQKQLRGPSIFYKIRNLAVQLCTFASNEHYLVPAYYGQGMHTPGVLKKYKGVQAKESFTSNEIATLWKYKENDTVKAILIDCYMGWRPTELLNIKISDIDLNNGIIVGGIKTNKGKNRRVPIPNNILPLIEDLMSKNKDYLIQSAPGHSNAPWDRNNWTKRKFYPTLEHIGILKDKKDRHIKPTCARKYCASIYRSAEVPDWLITNIMGHVSIDTTDEYYVTADIECLKKAADTMLMSKQKT